MDLINLYFRDIDFIHVPFEEYNGYARYVARLNGTEAGKIRYIFVFVKTEPYSDLPRSSRIYELSWSSIQTRLLNEKIKVPTKRWKLPKDERTMIYAKNRTDEQTVYEDDRGMLPFRISLIHDPKKKTKYQYNNRMTLLGALETFKCVLTKKYCSGDFCE